MVWPSPGSRLFKDHGYNWVRLRLFHSPDRLPNDLHYTIALARQAKGMGFKFLLDYHYSDTWADPAKQFTPQAWEGLSHEELVTAVHDYTRDTMIAFREAGAMPDMVQIGNAPAYLRHARRSLALRPGPDAAVAGRGAAARGGGFLRRHPGRDGADVRGGEGGPRQHAPERSTP